MKIGFIGCGNMGGALASAISCCDAQKELYLCDKNEELASSLALKINAKSVNLKEVLTCCDYIFVGIKPQLLSEVFASMYNYLNARQTKPVIISMMAGVKIEKIAENLPKNCPIIRIMPNTPVAVNCGMILYCHNELVDVAKESEFLKFMEKTGEIDKLDESLIDAGCAVSGCGPAFVYMFIEALAKGGELCGLNRQKALKYARQTVLGASTLAIKTNKEPNDLKNAVCSPNGSTIEGVKNLELNDFENVVISAVKKSFERTKELGK